MMNLLFVDRSWFYFFIITFIFHTFTLAVAKFFEWLLLMLRPVECIYSIRIILHYLLMSRARVVLQLDQRLRKAVQTLVDRGLIVSLRRLLWLLVKYVKVEASTDFLDLILRCSWFVGSCTDESFPIFGPEVVYPKPAIRNFVEWKFSNSNIWVVWFLITFHRHSISFI